MRVIVQRSKTAQVTVGQKVTGQIEHGLMLLVGFTHVDTEKDCRYLCDKIANLRIFEDEDGKMNRSIVDCGGQVLSVSQFTLYGDCRKGRRPSFAHAAPPEQAEQLYDRFNDMLRESGLRVETGIFGAMMDVCFTNSGPVTFILESPAQTDL